MVILQFNKLIRNKWIWGAFALVVSLAFVAPDEWFRSSDDPRNRDADARNKLPGAEYDGALFEQCEHLVRDFLPNFPRSPAARFFSKNSVKDAWKAYAAAVTLRKCGVAVPDALLAERIKTMFAGEDGGFSEKAYSTAVRQVFNVEPRTFEEQMRLLMLLETGMSLVASDALWLPPMAVEQTNRDFTDVFTVRVASFEEDKAEAGKIKLDDAGLKKWYDANSKTLALPDRYRLDYVKYDATSSNNMARAKIDEEAVKERYEANVAKGMYAIAPATTNDVKKTRPLEEVRASIETSLKQEKALEMLKAEAKAKTAIDDEDEAAVKALLPSLAKADGLKVETSDWFALSGAHVPNFMKSVSSQFPGVPRKDFDRIVRLLADYGYGIFSSSKAVWVVTLHEKSAAHTPTFEEAKGKIGDAALRDAKKDAFKAKVEAVAAKGMDAVLASKNTTTNLVFSPCKFAKDYAMSWDSRFGTWDFKNAGFANADKVVLAAKSLEKGQISPFVALPGSKALLVACIDRAPGDPADIFRGNNFSRTATIQSQAGSDFFGKWLDSNLESLGWKEPERAAQDDAAAAED